jgi:hypothetical protein
MGRSVTKQTQKKIKKTKKSRFTFFFGTNIPSIENKKNLILFDGLQYQAILTTGFEIDHTTNDDSTT